MIGHTKLSKLCTYVVVLGFALSHRYRDIIKSADAIHVMKDAAANLSSKLKDIGIAASPSTKAAEERERGSGAFLFRLATFLLIVASDTPIRVILLIWPCRT